MSCLAQLKLTNLHPQQCRLGWERCRRSSWRVTWCCPSGGCTPPGTGRSRRWGCPGPGSRVGDLSRQPCSSRSGESPPRTRWGSSLQTTILSEVCRACRAHWLLTCGSLQDIFDVAETETRLGHVLSWAAVGVVVVDWSLGGVVPHVDRVLGSRLIGVRPLIRSLSEVAGHYGSQKFVSQNLELVKTSGDVHWVQLTDVDPGIFHGEVLDEENVDLATVENDQLPDTDLASAYLASLLVYHRDPLVAGDPGGVGCQDLRSHLSPRVSLPHESQVVLVLHHAGQQSVVPLHLDQWGGEAVTQWGSWKLIAPQIISLKCPPLTLLALQQLQSLAGQQDQTELQSSRHHQSYSQALILPDQSIVHHQLK